MLKKEPYDDRTLREFKKWGQPLPSHKTHGTEDEIRDKMEQLLPNSWHMEGNKLVGRTKMGPLIQWLPTDYICLGTDENGLPVLKKVDIQK